MKGRCKWFNDAKGFGFITPEDGTSDIFVHFTGSKMPGRKTLVEGDPVEFDVIKSDKGPKADNVVIG